MMEIAPPDMLYGWSADRAINMTLLLYDHFYHGRVQTTSGQVLPRLPDDVWRSRNWYIQTNLVWHDPCLRDFISSLLSTFSVVFLSLTYCSLHPRSLQFFLFPQAGDVLSNCLNWLPWLPRRLVGEFSQRSDRVWIKIGLNRARHIEYTKEAPNQKPQLWKDEGLFIRSLFVGYVVWSIKGIVHYLMLLAVRVGLTPDLLIGCSRNVFFWWSGTSKWCHGWLSTFSASTKF